MRPPTIILPSLRTKSRIPVESQPSPFHCGTVVPVKSILRISSVLKSDKPISLALSCPSVVTDHAVCNRTAPLEIVCQVSVSKVVRDVADKEASGCPTTR